MLALAILLLGFFFAPPELCTLSGTVVNSVTGVPLNKVDLRAVPVDGDDSMAASATSDAQGNFTMVNLPPGQYRLKGIRNGYLDTYYGARRSESKGTPITLGPGQEMKSLVIKLLPFAVIAGTVRDADGEPLSGASIYLFRQHFDLPGHRTVELVVEGERTNDLGEYRIADLEPGKYFIEADPKNDGNTYGFLMPEDHSVKSNEPRMALLPTLYPQVTDPAAARTVEVGLGSRVCGIDISLVRGRVFSVTGRVSTAQRLAVTGLWMHPSLYPPIGFESVGAHFSTQSKSTNGDFAFTGVPEGSYTLNARVNPGEYLARVPLTVDHDVDGFVMAMTGGAEVSGHITIEGDDKAKLTGKPVRFNFPYSDRFAKLPTLREDNRFNVDLYPDRYNVSVDVPNLVIKSIRSERADVFQDGLTVMPGSKTNLEIVLAPEGALVEGVASDQDQKAVPGATVVLIAEPRLRLRPDSYHECTTDQYGRYHFENVRPGDYKLFAWDDPEPNAWFDPDFLKTFEEQGTKIVVEPQAHGTANLPVLAPGK